MKQKNQRIIREFGLSSFSVDNATSVFVLMGALVFLGIFSYVTMPKESYPEITIPNVYIGTAYPGNSPLDMENLVTRPIEKELNTIASIKKIESTSIQDYSTVVAEFGFDVDVDEAVQEVKDAVDRAMQNLPKDLPADPNVMEINMSEMPVINVNLSGFDDLGKLNQYAEHLQEEFEKFSEVKSVEIRGVPEKEVTINMDIQALEARKLGFGDIEGAISAENVSISGGDILTDNLRRNIRIVGEFKSISEIEDIIISNQNNAIVYLKDVASVKFGYEDRESYARERQSTVVTLDVMKRSGENLLYCIDNIKSAIEEAKASGAVSPQLEISFTNDQSRQTRSMLANLENSIISGIILVVLVLLFFMGLRNAIFVGIAIPLSMFTGFLIFGFSGNTLNIMVLFSLILALGMLVDNGIVVVENIYRLMDEGLSPMRAAKEGVGEVALPIISSTATTLAAFLPLLFWQDIMGEFMKFLPITLIIVLTSSLFVALVINPVLTANFMRVGEQKTNYRSVILWTIASVALSVMFYMSGSNLYGSLFAILAAIILLNTFILAPASKWFQSKVMPFLERIYQKFVRFALTKWRPYLFFAGTFALLIFSINLLSNAGLKTLLFPNNEPNYINIFIKHPVGTDIAKTDLFAKEVEKEVLATMKPYDYMVESILAKVGQGTSDPMASMGPADGNTPNKSRITISFLEYAFRQGVSTLDVMEELRGKLDAYAGVTITIDKDPAGPPPEPPINLEISGPEYDELITLSTDVKRFLDDKNIPGAEELKMDLETGKPEMIVHIDRDKARRFGLSTGQIGSTIRTAIFGKEISKLKDGEDDYPINLRFNDENRYDINAILNQKITFRNNQGQLKQVPIKAVAEVEYSSSYGSVKRKDLDRVITIYSNVTEGYNGNEIVQQYRQIMTDYPLPEGYSYVFTGEQEQMMDAMTFLMRAMGVAVLVIFLIMVSQFNSIATPFIIIMSVLFSTIGVFLGYVIFQMDFIVIMTGIGIISLAGIVVNNAIVLIDYTNLVRLRMRKELGLKYDEDLNTKQVINAVVEAGTKRLRPVLLTAITTVLGLVPLAIGLNIDFVGLLESGDPDFYIGGENAIFWGPMAWTVIFGLVFATFLTLVVVPIMYLGLDRLSYTLFKTGISGRKGEPEEVEVDNTNLLDRQSGVEDVQVAT